MKTTFIHARVELAANVEIVIDGNSKITLGNGTYADPRPNAFSLPAASVDGWRLHCPGSTSACRASCYVRGLAQHAPDLYAAYQGNAEALSGLLNWGGGMIDRSAEAFGNWIRENAADGFRWHVSGDVWHSPHAAWIVRVAWASRNVRHWIYTRTFDALPILKQADNLAINVSADRDNYAEASAAAEKHGLRIAYMSTARDDLPGDLPDGSVIFPDYPMRGRSLPIATEAPWWKELTHREKAMTCPADFFGQSESARCGPCSKCLHP